MSERIYQVLFLCTGNSAAASSPSGVSWQGVLLYAEWGSSGASVRRSLGTGKVALGPVNYNLPGGWYLVSAPIMTADRKADDSGDRWTVPLGGGFGRVFHMGRQPVNAQTQAFYNVAHPDVGPRWSLRLQLQLLFPKGAP